MKFLLLCVLSLLSLCPTAQARTQDKNWCQPTSAPTINVHTSTDQITYDFTLSEKDLDKFTISTVNPYGDNMITEVGGLMKGGIEAQQKMSFGTLTNQKTQQICYWHNNMDVFIHIMPTIYIASNFPVGSCMHNAIMAHEQKHITVDREIVNKYAALIGDALKQEVSNYRVYGPVPISQQPYLESQLKQRIQSLLKYYTTQMTNERRTRQQQIDSLAEYERVNHLCPNQKR